MRTMGLSRVWLGTRQASFSRRRYVSQSYSWYDPRLYLAILHRILFLSRTTDRSSFGIRPTGPCSNRSFPALRSPLAVRPFSRDFRRPVALVAGCFNELCHGHFALCAPSFQLVAGWLTSMCRACRRPVTAHLHSHGDQSRELDGRCVFGGTQECHCVCRMVVWRSS